MHLKRWLTSLVALPLLVLLIFKGGVASFSIFMGIIMVLAVWEYTRIISGEADAAHLNPLSFVNILSGMALIWAASTRHPALFPLILSFSLILTGFISLRRFQYDADISRKAAFVALGGIYIPLAMAYAVMIRQEPSGGQWVFFIACVIFAGDTGAYYAGTYFGTHKLCPSVSPGKTIEGAIGGLAANIGIGVVYKLLFLPAVSMTESLIFCLAIGSAGQIGDLFESVLKRSAGVKDSGNILPGHGGILDRIDAILFALPVAYFLKVFYLTP
ncbi:MAG: phosphatidate cytidylyltransferase [Desulfobacterales bacterium]|jgi:phosphatidate cytidylyltransferase|nr:phosphatidate cytidylyltransferase [Desulfobacterales bacterium]